MSKFFDYFFKMVLVFLVISAIAFAFKGISYLAESRRAKRITAEKLVADILTATESCQIIVGNYINDGPFVVPDKEITGVDPWGNPYVIVYELGTLSHTVSVSSLGPDGQENTEDDISYTSSKKRTVGNMVWGNPDKEEEKE